MVAVLNWIVESHQNLPYTFCQDADNLNQLMSASDFKFYCSHCDQPLKCDPCYAGRQIQCPSCQHLIRIPNPPAGTGFTQVNPESGHTWDTHPPKGEKG